MYRGLDPDIGDLYCHRPEQGEVWTVWEPDEEELELLNQGGRVLLKVLTEPFPPVALAVFPESDTHPVGPHPWKVIPELDEREDQ